MGAFMNCTLSLSFDDSEITARLKKPQQIDLGNELHQIKVYEE